MIKLVLYLFGFILIRAAVNCRGEDGEKNEKKKDEQKKRLRLHRFKSDEPDLQESAFWKKIIAYQRKLLVSTDVATAGLQISNIL